MIDPFQIPLELESRLLSALSGEASDEDLAKLRSALADSEELRQQACEFLYDDALITNFCRTEKERRDISIRLAVGGVDAEEPAHQTLHRYVRRVVDRVNHHGLAVAAIACTLLVALFGYVYLLESKLDRLYAIALVDEKAGQTAADRAAGHATERSPKGVQRQVLGRVTGLHNAVWGEGATRLKFGDRVETGQMVDITSGVVELLLSSGAKVTIEGPARFEATSELEANLEMGKIAAAAPRVARGYTVLTPTSELVDIGTQFGVLVDDHGDSELHVFDGDVVARSRGDGASRELMHARENEAMRFQAASPVPERIAARKDDFVRQIRPPQNPSKLPRLPLSDQLSIWYASDMCNEYVPGEHVLVWRDLLVGDNTFADDAWQFDEARAPTLMQDNAGKPALRFDGWSTYLATSPIQPQPQQTICVVCSPAPNSYANDLQGQMLLKYGDAPSVELSLIGANCARGWVWPGSGPNVADVRTKTLATGKPSVLLYEYDSQANKSRLWLNGSLQSSSDAPIAVLQPGRKYIGSHSDLHVRAMFFGGLYELLVFDKCFEQDKLDRLWEYFNGRYAFE